MNLLIFLVKKLSVKSAKNAHFLLQLLHKLIVRRHYLAVNIFKTFLKITLCDQNRKRNEVIFLAQRQASCKQRG